MTTCQHKPAVVSLWSHVMCSITGLPEVEEEEDEEEITEAVEAQMEEGYEENDQEEKELEDAPHENGS